MSTTAAIIIIIALALSSLAIWGLAIFLWIKIANTGAQELQAFLKDKMGWPLEGEEGKKRIRSLRRLFLLVMLGCLIGAIISAQEGFNHGGLTSGSIGRVFLFSGALLLLSAVYLAALYFLLYSVKRKMGWR